jgi:GT2 family glycosyltransferase
MVSVVIPVFNKVELTQRCLESVLRNSRALSELTVIDNASSDSTPEALLDWEARFSEAGVRFRIIRNEQNVGFGRACNEGIRISTGAYVAVVNNDTWLMEGWDQALINEIEARGLDEVGPFFDERPWVENPEARAREFLIRNPRGFRKHFVPILMFFTRGAVERLRFDHGGLFDERFFVTYEDTDLLYRMKQIGLRYGQTSKCYIWHHSMGTRSTPGLLPSGYEQEGLKLFVEKWGFDPRPAEHTLIERWKRKWRTGRAKRGRF